MNKRSEMLRAFLIAAVGVVVGVGVMKVTNGASVTVIAVVLGVLAFLWFRVRARR